MSNKVVWSDEHGDLRKKESKVAESEVDESTLELSLRRLTSGKGRTIIEIGDLPQNKKWCKKLAKELKKELAVGGAYKNDFIEVHGEKMEQIKIILNKKGLKFVNRGG